MPLTLYKTFACLLSLFTLARIACLLHMCVKDKKSKDLMHQLIPAALSLLPPPPRATAGHLSALSVPGVGHLQILHCPGAGHLPTPGPFVSFWHSRSFLSEYNYTAFTGKNADQLTCQGRKKLKRVVKACSRFYACISSLLIKPELHSENRS